jgi:hypothetical protein
MFKRVAVTILDFANGGVTSSPLEVKANCRFSKWRAWKHTYSSDTFPCSKFKLQATFDVQDGDCRYLGVSNTALVYHIYA